MPTLYSVKEAAERLGVGTTTVNRWVKLGEFPNAYKLNPRAKNSPFRIPEEDIVAFEEERQQYLTRAAE